MDKLRHNFAYRAVWRRTMADENVIQVAISVKQKNASLKQTVPARLLEVQQSIVNL